MLFSKLFAKKKSMLGVDIGTANIKVVQIDQAETPVLQTYGIVNTPYQLGGKNDEQALPEMAKLLKTLLEKAGVTTRRCVISFPNISVFSSVIELPSMSDSELALAVEHEAKKYIPLSLTDVDMDWVMISKDPLGKGTIKVLLTAVPKQVTKNYRRLFEMAGLEHEVGEIEGLALIRSLVGNAPTNCVIIDIGAKSTGLNIIENGYLRLSRNLNIGGETITAKIAQTLNISEARAEQFKRDFGVSGSTFIPEAIRPVLNVIKTETKQLVTLYQSQNNKKLEKIILVGGGANLPAITSFFSDLPAPVELGNPLRIISYSKNLSAVLQRHALSLPIAIGLALRNE